MSQIKPVLIKIIIAPVLLAIFSLTALFAIVKVGEENPRYQIDKLAETAKITAYDIRFGWGARFGEGSGYYLGELDGSFRSILSLAPSAVNVSLFRPYLWEVQNPLMLLSALESLAVLVITIWVILKIRLKLFKYLSTPEILYCLIFSLVFAFAVGISTYNFGTLSRYKIPMMPYYLSGLVMLYYNSKRDRKLEVLDSTE